MLILGANGGIARHVIERVLKDTDARLTLYLRNANRLGKLNAERARIVEAMKVTGLKRLILLAPWGFVESS
ncbi:NAD(P)H-binding protein [Paenibacillus sp. BIC5C1]|uniref:NAD(P)H-binding protein n=1 Tax=Paenibacillus sp. BIC5C1 TaxID=3078263 RepID=UPI0037CBA0FA